MYRQSATRCTQRLICIILIFGLSTCSSYESHINISKIDKNTLRIVGNVEPEIEKDIIHAIKSNISKILITSGGGEVRTNIRIAKAIREKGIELEVVDYCLSSCFNYLFLAATVRNIQQNSILGFHGTAETSMPGLLRKFGFFRDTINNERQFIKDMNFHENIYKRLLERSEITIKKSGIEANFFMVGKKFFDENDIQLNDVWFPKNQNELNEVVTMIINKYGKEKEQYKTLTMIGDFDK